MVTVYQCVFAKLISEKKLRGNLSSYVNPSECRDCDYNFNNTHIIDLEEYLTTDTVVLPCECNKAVDGVVYMIPDSIVASLLNSSASLPSRN
jgi:hypothetical protein